MSKRILFLMTDKRFMNFFEQIALRALKEGHDVLVICSTPVDEEKRFKMIQERYDNFDFTSIEKFDPTTIIVFNGYHPSLIPAIKYLKLQYNLFHCECGWLPQKARAYLDTDMGYGGQISKCFQKIPGYKFSNKQVRILEFLKDYYKPKIINKKLPKTFILIPLQLEHDVSIWKDSPQFRLMRSLIGFVNKFAPGMPIIAKQHPLGLGKDRYNDWNKLNTSPGVDVVYDKSISTNDLVTKCTIMVGINSTCFAEALVHHKPQITFGGGVVSPANDDMFRNAPYLSELIRDIHNGKHIVDHEMMDQKILYLYANQFRITDPTPDWLFDKVINYVRKPRSFEDLT